MRKRVFNESMMSAQRICLVWTGKSEMRAVLGLCSAGCCVKELVPTAHGFCFQRQTFAQ